MSTATHRYATSRSPIIQAVAKGLYRFKNTADAEAVLQTIRTQFTLAKEQPEEMAGRGFILWIEGFSLTKAEKDDGFKGHYALVSHHKTDDKLFYTLSATKLESDLAYHPQKGRAKERMPNWGHPILRGVQKGQVFPSKQEALATLQQLQMQFPTTAIPGTNKLHLMVFSRKEDAKNPVGKYVLEIEPAAEGEGYVIAAKKRRFDAAAAKSLPSTASAEPPVGYFTQMLAGKRKKK